MVNERSAPLNEVNSSISLAARTSTLKDAPVGTIAPQVRAPQLIFGNLPSWTTDQTPHGSRELSALTPERSSSIIPLLYGAGSGMLKSGPPKATPPSPTLPFSGSIRMSIPQPSLPLPPA